MTSLINHYPKIDWKNDDQENIEIENYFRLVAMIMKKFPNIKGMDRDDMFQTGVIGLLKAKKAFNPKKGIQFSTFAARCIENEYLMELRRARSNTNLAFTESVSIDMFHAESKEETARGEGFHLHHILRDQTNVEDIVLTRFARKELLDDWEPKNPMLKIVAECHMSGNIKQKEMGEYIGISQSYASRLVARYKQRAALYFGIKLKPQIKRKNDGKKEDVLSMEKRNKSVEMEDILC